MFIFRKYNIVGPTSRFYYEKFSKMIDISNTGIEEKFEFFRFIAYILPSGH